MSYFYQPFCSLSKVFFDVLQLWQSCDIFFADDGLDSLRSDGIPVGDELSGERDQYIWASENTSDSIENPDSDEADSSPSKKSEKVTDLSTQYPEELPDRLSEVRENTRTFYNSENVNWFSFFKSHHFKLVLEIDSRFLLILFSDCQRPNLHSHEKPTPQHDSFWRSDYCHRGSTRAWHWKLSWYDFPKVIDRFLFRFLLE